MKLGLMTTQRFALASFNHLRKNYEDFQIITIKPELAFAHKVSGYYDFKHICKKFNVPCTQLNNYSFNDKNDIENFKSLKLDILLVFGWNRLIPIEILNQVKFGTIGSHSSPGILPFGREVDHLLFGQ